MKAHYKVSDRLVFEVDTDSQKDMFRQLASIDEVFGDNTCPLTKSGQPSDKVIFSVRKDKEGNEYFERKCTEAPYAALSYGQHKNTKTLFPRRKDSEGNWMDNKGWFVWKKKEE